MDKIENYLCKDKFHLDLKKHLIFDKVEKKDKILQKLSNILSQIETIINGIYNIKNNINAEKETKDIFQNFTTAIDISISIYNICMNGGEGRNRSKYNEIENILKEHSTYSEVEDFDWKKVIKKIREIIQHDGEKLKITTINNIVYMQHFKENKYPEIVEFINDSKYVECTVFFSFKFQCLLAYLKVLFEYLIEMNSSQGKEYLMDVIVEDDFSIEEKKVQLLQKECERAQEIIKKLKPKDIQNIELYKNISVVGPNENIDKLKVKMEKLKKLVKEIEEDNFSEAEDFLKSEVYFYLANAQLIEKDYKNARKNYDKCLGYNTSPAIYTNIIKSYLDELKQDEKNREWYIVQINNCIEKINKNIKEILSIDKTLEAEQEVDGLFNNIAGAYEELNQYDEAIKYFKMCFKLGGKHNNNSVYNLGRLYRKLGDANLELRVEYFKCAIFYLKQAIEYNPKDIDAYERIMYVSWEIKEYDVFKEYFIKGLSENLLSETFYNWCNWIIDNRSYLIMIYGISIIEMMYKCLNRINSKKKTVKIQDMIKKIDYIIEEYIKLK